jgi:hypothetical protein
MAASGSLSDFEQVTPGATPVDKDGGAGGAPIDDDECLACR